jgi:hypothetical protein
MEMIELFSSELYTITPSVLSIVLLWKLRSLEQEVQRLHDAFLRHLEVHATID